jgi:hypothetical protein
VKTKHVLFDCSGTQIKTRKPNIAVLLDIATFGDVVVQIYLEHHGDLVTYFVMMPP